MEPKYPKTLKAAKAVEHGGYGMASALWAEVAKTETGNAKKGELQRVQEFLTKNSVGDTYTISWLSDLHTLGGWISGSDRKLPMPPRMAMEARTAKLTPDEAITQWELGTDDGEPWTLRTWAATLGRKWSDIAAATATELMEKAEAADVEPEAMVEEAVKVDPNAVSKAAKKSKAVLDDAYKAVDEDDPKEIKPEEEELPDLHFVMEIADIVLRTEQIIKTVGKLEGRLLSDEQKGKLETTARRLDATAGTIRAIARDEAEEAIRRILAEAEAGEAHA